MIKANDLVILMPAYNEARVIEDVIKKIMPYADVIVVDDGSSDQTAEKARSAGAVVISTINQGYEQALQTAAQRARQSQRWQYAVTCDADGQHTYESVQRVYAELRRGVDLVVGYRPYLGRMSEYIVAYMALLLWGIRDPFCGMKGYRINSALQPGLFIAAGPIAQAKRWGMSIKQVPISVQKRLDGVSRFGASWSAEWRLIRAWLQVIGLRCGIVHGYRHEASMHLAQTRKDERVI